MCERNACPKPSLYLLVPAHLTSHYLYYIIMKNGWGLYIAAIEDGATAFEQAFHPSQWSSFVAHAWLPEMFIARFLKTLVRVVLRRGGENPNSTMVSDYRWVIIVA